MPDPTARRVHQLLNQAMDVEKERRREFLQEACREAPELASRLEQLIAAVLDSQSFLEEPALKVFGKGAWIDETELPQFVGNYEILRKLGSGGMGTVYEAMQKQPQRTVALKIPRTRRWKQDIRQQLRYESELLGKLRHAYIAQVYEAGVDDSQPDYPLPYFAMEFVPSARTICEYVRQQQLEISGILSLMRRVCEAVQHAHRLGIIHRDLKPANVLIDADGNPKVIDFGVASSHVLGNGSVRPSSQKTESESAAGMPLSPTEDSEPIRTDASPPMAGTLNYMSPEQCDPASTIDARTDVYSLGIMLYELLCETLPYDLKGLPLAQALEIIQKRPPRTAMHQGRLLPKDVGVILNKSLEKDRNQRYSSVEALHEDLGRFLESRPISARKPRFGYVAALAIRRNRWQAAAASLLILTIVAGSIVSAVFAWRASAEVQRRRLAETETLRQLDQAVWQSYIANMMGAFSAFQNREIALVRSRLAAAPKQHRNWEWDFLNGMIEINEQVIPAHDGMILSFAQSVDGTRWASGSQDGITRVWDSQTGKLVREITHRSTSKYRPHAKPPMVTALAFRNGSSQLVSGTGDGAIRIWEAETGELELQLAGHQASITTISVSPDGTIASTCGRNRAKLWDGKQTRPVREIKDEQSEVSGVQFCDQGRLLVTWEPLGSIWLRSADTLEIAQRFRFGKNIRRLCASHDGTWIVAGGLDNRLQLWQPGASQSESRMIEIPGVRSSVDSLCFSPNNKRLAIGRVDRQIFEYSVEDLSRIGQLQGHEEFVRAVCYDPSGKRLVSASGDGTLRVWSSEDKVLGNIKAATDGDRSFNSLAISPDGERIAATSSDRSIGIYDGQLQLIRKLPVKHLGQILTIAWSPKDSTIASAGFDRSVRIWNTETGHSQLLSPPHLGAIHRLAHSPDGKWLVSAGADHVLRVWDLESQTRSFELFGHKHSVISLRFSMDGRWLASGAEDGSLILWDWQERKMSHQLTGHRSQVFSLAFDPSGQRLYSGSRDRTIRVWSTSSGEALDVLSGHGQLIRSLDIHPDGTRLVAGSWFGDILFWDLKRHELVATFKGHADIVNDLAFDPNGKYFASCSLDKSLRKFERGRTLSQE